MVVSVRPAKIDIDTHRSLRTPDLKGSLKPALDRLQLPRARLSVGGAQLPLEEHGVVHDGRGADLQRYRTRHQLVEIVRVRQ